MLNLTFGEQVKIVLSRKGMTIKELAELIEEKTGKKMSRQNLTQRLGRDNFQEQDMRMIAEILGCSFQLSILASLEAVEKAAVIEEDLPTEVELGRLAAKKEQKASKPKKAARDITIGEIMDLMEDEPEVPEVEEEPAREVVEEPVQEVLEAEEVAEPSEEKVEEVVEAEKAAEEVVEEAQTEEQEEVAQPAAKDSEAEEKIDRSKESRLNRLTRVAAAQAKKEEGFQPIKSRQDEDEDVVNGDVNPYTGHEYQTNSVRMHPKRIGYVQVYNRKEHKWVDMTEWAFLGAEERKKASLGKEYEPPIYLD